MPKRLGPTTAISSLFLATLLANSSSAQQHRQDFYLPPVPLPAAQHGKLIRSQPLNNAAAMPDASRNLLVMYHSTNADGKDIAVTGTIAIPAGDPPPGGWPVTTWTHGTTGIASACAPSRDTPQSSEHPFLQLHDVLMNEYVKRGYVVVATDFEGLGEPGLQPFLQGVAEGHGALDLLRAAREIDLHIGKRYVIIGHSQGGQADLFAASLGPAYVPELELLGDVALAPASHIGATLQGMARASTPSYALGYSMYVLQSFASNHASIDLKKILTTKALNHLPETLSSCITSLVSKGYWATAVPKDQFFPNANLTPVLAVAKKNEPGTVNIATPTLIAQGTADDTVLPAWTDSVAHSLCKNGVPLRYSVYPGANHETIVKRSAAEISTWVDARFASKPATGNCDALPSAALAGK